MRYTMFVGENCHDCKLVGKKIVEMRLDITVENIDDGAKPPMDVYILPALFDENNNLKAYGIDIIDFIRERDDIPQTSTMSRLKALLKKLG